jgi:hypothetical protein
LPSSFLRFAALSPSLKLLCRSPSAVLSPTRFLRPLHVSARELIARLVVQLRRLLCCCYMDGAAYWGFAQRPTTNGVLSLDSPIWRSVEWQQLARRTSPLKSREGSNLFELPATTRAAPQTAPGQDSQLRSGFDCRRLRAASSRSSMDSHEMRLRTVSPWDRPYCTDRLFEEPHLRYRSERENRAGTFSVRAQGVNSC